MRKEETVADEMSGVGVEVILDSKAKTHQSPIHLEALPKENATRVRSLLPSPPLLPSRPPAPSPPPSRWCTS